MNHACALELRPQIALVLCATYLQVRPLGASHPDFLSRAVCHAQIVLDLDSARGLVRQVAETCDARAVNDAEDDSRGGPGVRVGSSSGVCRWEGAKVQWSTKGEHGTDALLVAQRLRVDLHFFAAKRSEGRESLGIGEGQLHWEVLRELGIWVDTLRCESRGAIESEILGRAVKLSEQTGDWAAAQALFALARFHERQFVALSDEAVSSSFAKFISVKARTVHELRLTQNELLRVDGWQTNRYAKRRKILEQHERELTIQHRRDELESSVEQERAELLESAIENYVLSLRRASSKSETACAAASAVIRLWIRNREYVQVSTRIEQDLRTGLADRVEDFAPLASQLTTRLNSATETDGGANGPRAGEKFCAIAPGGILGIHVGRHRARQEPGAAFQNALSALILEIDGRSKYQQLVLHQLLADLARTRPHEKSKARRGVDGVQQGRLHASTILIRGIRLRPDRRAPADAAIAICTALRRLAFCPHPHTTPGEGACVGIAHALAGACIDSAYDISRIHERGHRIDLVSLPPAISLASSEGNSLRRYLPTYVMLPSGIPPGVKSRCLPHVGYAKLVWCEDERGRRHALFLKAVAQGALDTRRDALVHQVMEELSRRLNEQRHARQRQLKVRGRRVLPLSPFAGLYEWCGHAAGIHGLLALEHATAHDEGRERLDLSQIESDLIAAQAGDALCVQLLSSAEARLAMSGAVVATSAVKRIGPAFRSVWARARSGTSPLLNRVLQRTSPSPEAWLARRMHLTRSLATSSIVCWVLGLGERAPHRILLDHGTAEAVHVSTQAIFQQQPGLNAKVAQGTGAAFLQHGGVRQSPPFRLTREVVNVLGPTGVDGPFRCAAEICLRAAQREKANATLIALLEVFVDEPMIGWVAEPDGALVSKAR